MSRKWLETGGRRDTPNGQWEMTWRGKEKETVVQLHFTTLSASPSLWQSQARRNSCSGGWQHARVTARVQLGHRRPLVLQDEEANGQAVTQRESRACSPENLCALGEIKKSVVLTLEWESLLSSAGHSINTSSRGQGKGYFGITNKTEKTALNL